jgi:hypothetical protein
MKGKPMVAKSLLCAAFLLAFSTEAHALCRDDLSDMKPRIDQVKLSDPQRYQLAITWWGRAQEAEPGSESECLNFLAQARKALFGPLPVLVNCNGPNAYLPNCQLDVQNANGGFTPVGPAQALGGVGGIGGGGGAAPPFNPPGSPSTPGSTEATGTDR